MSWQYKGILGTIPGWVCDSCTTTKDGTCSYSLNVLGAFDAASKQQFLPRMTGGSEKATAEALTPMAEMIEAHCPHAAANVKEKPAAAQERTFYYSGGMKVYSDGELVPLTADEKMDVQRNENAERIRNFSPHIGQ